MKQVIYHQFRSRPKKHFPPFPSNYCTEYLSSALADKEYGMRLMAAQGYDTEKLYAMVEGGEGRHQFGKMLLRRFADPRHLSGLVKWSERRMNSLRDYLDVNFSVYGLKKISNDQFVKRYKKYVYLYRIFHLKNTPPWWIGADAVEDELRKELAGGRYGNIDDVFHMLTSGSEYPTEGFLDESSLLDICKLLSKNKIKRVKNTHTMPANVRKLFMGHVKEFCSMPFGYNTGVLWGEKHFIKEINNILKKKEEPVKIREAKLSAVFSQIKERENFEKKNKISKKIIILAKALRQLAYLQDLKKTTQTRSHPHLNNVVYPEITRRTGLKKKYYGYLSEFDIEAILKQGRVTKEQNEEFDERLKTCVAVMKDLKYTWLYGDKAIRFLTDAGAISPESSDVKEFRGIIASQGKAKGLVKVCLHSTEIRKVKEGNILVASMTTPDFVPAMKKAAAIITDEGGITSHAAIVSRELHKPCIIGAKIATKVLKDGMIVEIDANKGVVRIIK